MPFRSRPSIRFPCNALSRTTLAAILQPIVMREKEGPAARYLSIELRRPDSYDCDTLAAIGLRAAVL